MEDLSDRRCSEGCFDDFPASSPRNLAFDEPFNFECFELDLRDVRVGRAGVEHFETFDFSVRSIAPAEPPGFNVKVSVRTKDAKRLKGKMSKRKERGASSLDISPKRNMPRRDREVRRRDQDLCRCRMEAMRWRWSYGRKINFFLEATTKPCLFVTPSYAFFE